MRVCKIKLGGAEQQDRHLGLAAPWSDHLFLKSKSRDVEQGARAAAEHRPAEEREPERGEAVALYTAERSSTIRRLPQ
jgi:hypothetical protein